MATSASNLLVLHYPSFCGINSKKSRMLSHHHIYTPSFVYNVCTQTHTHTQEVKPCLHKLSTAFCCTRARRSANTDKDRATNADVETMMEMSKLRQDLTFKVLILGCGEAGKTTFLNQIDLMFNPDSYTSKMPKVINGLR